MLNKYIFAIVTLFIALFAAGCGGAQFAAPVADVPSTSGQIPSVFAEFNGAVTRGASDVTTIPGSDALMNVGGTIDGTTMIIDSSSTAGDMAWALYKVSGLAGRRATTLGIELSLPQLNTPYSVGVANFSEGVWDFLQDTQGLPEFNFDLSAEQSRLVSQLGNLYFVVVVSGGNSATILRASVLSEVETPQNETLPLRAQRPSVSEGLVDRIEVSWQAVDGAESYELWRRLDAAGDAAWELIATQAELNYTDTAIELSTEYQYKVRALNSAGAGGFSEKRSGFAGTPPAGHDENEDEDIEVTGMISTIAENSFTIGEQTFAVNENTLFFGASQTPLTFADLAVGVLVEVEADADGLGGWTARKVEMEAENEDETGDDNGGQGGDDTPGDDNGGQGGDDTPGDDNGGGGGDDDGGHGGGGDDNQG